LYIETFEIDLIVEEKENVSVEVAAEIVIDDIEVKAEIAKRTETEGIAVAIESAIAIVVIEIATLKIDLIVRFLL